MMRHGPGTLTPAGAPHPSNDKYVIVYDTEKVDTERAQRDLTNLLTDLETAGLYTEVRPGYDMTILIFAKAPRELLGNAVYKSRVKDWLFGIITRHPGGNKDTIVDGAYEAEDILSVYHLVSWPKSLGGAGITPEWGQWEHVKSIFPLHNEAKNQALLKHLSKRLVLTMEDLDQIRDLFGTKVAFYFAFIQTYLVLLTFPAATGFITWFLGGRYSLTYAITTCVWCTFMVEYWKIQQTDLSIRWGVRNIASAKVNRPQFQWEKSWVDETGRTRYYFPRWKLILRHLLQIPFVLLATIALGAIIIAVFALEILITEGYQGPYKTVVEFLPTIMLALALPGISGFLESIADAMTDFENHRTADTYEMSRTQKRFILSGITNYLPILVTAFLYVPFGERIIPWLSLKTRALLGPLGPRVFFDEHQSFNVDSGRLRDEVIALALTGQVSSFFEENIIPVAKRKFQGWYRDYRAAHYSGNAMIAAAEKDDPLEAEFLHTARNQATLDTYNVQDDIAEVVIQFGYLALFSPVWPLISIGFLINNVIELRTDFLKIVTEQQRPAPVRSDGIGPWISSLDFLTWAGSITTGAIVHLFGANSIAGGAWWALPITIFISEHIFVALRAMVRFVLQRMGSRHIRKERGEKYAVRAKYLEEMEANKQAGARLTVAERDRRKSIRAFGGDSFFTKQIEDGASALVAISLVQACGKDGRSQEGAAADGKKEI
ncbi:unnamed protein product [Clonostachys solani]|uniref:Plasma membrane channel protein n=1 Tax=Clonostachys solani TaxID=160281 RepID=A0A9N9VYQ7_9HYPO|nr:unnamed protein product [Clonostachys solani]